MNVAIIVASGSGTRFGSETPKQFLEILGKPLVVHTLERFEYCPAIDAIVLVLPANEIKPNTDKTNADTIRLESQFLFDLSFFSEIIFSPLLSY